MASLIFVHGTGVRSEAYKQTMNVVRGELRAERPLLKIHECLWGDPHGVQLRAGGASVPTYETARDIAAIADDEEQELALWESSYADPVFELRLLAQSASPPAIDQSDDDSSGERAPGEESASTALNDLVREFVPSPEMEAILKASGLDVVWPDAYAYVVESSAYRSALRTIRGSGGEHRLAISHGMVAAAIVAARDQGVPPPGSDIRDRLVEEIVERLGGSERAISEWVKAPLVGLATRLGTRYATRKRGAITDAAYPAAGDILLYQARGQDIRDFIENIVSDCEPPVTLLAHSLGGIACVDLLVAKALPDVVQLITVGSQASFLYEIDALVKLRYGLALPEHFPAWLNIYDPRDILSYIVEGIPQFKERPKETRDEKVESRQPFPEAHSAYWNSRIAWKAILSVLP